MAVSYKQPPCDYLNVLAFGYNKLCQSQTKNSLPVTTQMLCPLATTNCVSLRLQTASLWLLKWCGLWLQQTVASSDRNNMFYEVLPGQSGPLYFHSKDIHWIATGRGNVYHFHSTLKWVLQLDSTLTWISSRPWIGTCRGDVVHCLATQVEEVQRLNTNLPVFYDFKATMRTYFNFEWNRVLHSNRSLLTGP